MLLLLLLLLGDEVRITAVCSMMPGVLDTDTISRLSLNHH